MNFAQNQFVYSCFTSLLLWEAVIFSSKLPEMGNGGLSSNGDPQASSWHYWDRDRQDPPAHNIENLTSLETSAYSFIRKKTPKLSSVGPQHWSRDRSFPKTWRHKKRKRNCVLSQNETRHENFQTGIFSLAFPIAFEAFHWECLIFPLQLQQHNLSMLMHFLWLINLMIFPLTGLWWVVWDWCPHWDSVCTIHTLCYLHVSQCCPTP